MSNRAPPFAPGRIVGHRYTIQATLGRSPRATTHSAITTPSREVALRVLSVPPSSREPVLQAIQDQNEALRAVADRFALHVLDLGVDDDSGCPYLVVPLSPNLSLARLVEPCPLTPTDAGRFVHSLTRAIEAAHTANVPHLALRPTNVFIGPAPDYAVQLTDFSSEIVRRLPGRPGGPPVRLAGPRAKVRSRVPAIPGTTGSPQPLLKFLPPDGANP